MQEACGPSPGAGVPWARVLAAGLRGCEVWPTHFLAHGCAALRLMKLLASQNGKSHGVRGKVPPQRSSSASPGQNRVSFLTSSSLFDPPQCASSPHGSEILLGGVAVGGCGSANPRTLWSHLFSVPLSSLWPLMALSRDSPPVGTRHHSPVVPPSGPSVCPHQPVQPGVSFHPDLGGPPSPWSSPCTCPWSVPLPPQPA